VSLRRLAAGVAAVVVTVLLGATTVAVVTLAAPTARADGSRFWTDDTSRYRSPWFSGSHRIMIPFGCTAAPYYPHDPRCPGQEGFHHGIDVAMRCGTPLYAGVRARVVDPAAAGSLGTAYGPKAFRLRHDGHDVVLGHVQRVYVRPGDVVHPGDLIARAGNLAAPDGCHLHFEVRPAGGGYTSAVRPRPYLDLQRVG
jgi:murein DD-endopeptidase MepM/ murein hydrolase activator NlpD